MGTVIEAEELSELFDGIQAAHEAIYADRVRTALRIDDDRDREQNAAERVAAVEDALGRTPTGEPPAQVIYTTQQPITVLRASCVESVDNKLMRKNDDFMFSMPSGIEFCKFYLV